MQQIYFLMTVFVLWSYIYGGYLGAYQKSSKQQYILYFVEHIYISGILGVKRPYHLRLLNCSGKQYFPIPAKTVVQWHIGPS